mgnify:CR=1 FL=1
MISIADAKNRLPALIHQAEAGEAVTITRRGKPVAVVISFDEYERVRGAASSWMNRLDAWRKNLPDGVEGLTDTELDAVRDRAPYVPRVDFGAAEYADLDAVQGVRAAEAGSARSFDRMQGRKQ